jgi:hypothetical protein
MSEVALFGRAGMSAIRLLSGHRRGRRTLEVTDVREGQSRRSD